MLRKILILEDNLEIMKGLQAIIKELPDECEVLAADNVKDAYLYAMERNIDLFLVDVVLDTSIPGDVSGLVFVNNIRMVERYLFVPVIFMTGLEDEKLYTYEKLHGYRFIEKPFDYMQVKKTIEECLRFPLNKNQWKTLYFQKDGVIYAIETEDLVYAQSRKRTMYFYLSDGDAMSIPYISIKRLLNETDSPKIVQCSRNTVINVRYIQYVDFVNRVIQLQGNRGKIELGITFKEKLREILR